MNGLPSNDSSRAYLFCGETSSFYKPMDRPSAATDQHSRFNNIKKLLVFNRFNSGITRAGKNL
jgi:hypothetical protein